MKTKTIIFVLIFGAVALLGSFFLVPQKTSDQGQKKISIGGTEIQVELAESISEKYQGLSGRESICENCGMLFVFDRADIQHFVMRGMKFPLDFVFIREEVVVDLQENVIHPSENQQPEVIISRVEADQVLELNAGFIKDRGIFLGDQVRYEAN